MQSVIIKCTSVNDWQTGRSASALRKAFPVALCCHIRHTNDTARHSCVVVLRVHSQWSHLIFDACLPNLNLGITDRHVHPHFRMECLYLFMLQTRKNIDRQIVRLVVFSFPFCLQTLWFPSANWVFDHTPNFGIELLPSWAQHGVNWALSWSMTTDLFYDVE